MSPGVAGGRDGVSDLDQQARDVLDSVRYVVLATLDEDGRPRTSPVYFTPDRYARLYWVSHPDTQHSANLHRDPRASGVVFDSTRPPGLGEAVYVTGTAREIGVHELAAHVPVAFDPARGARRFEPEELHGDADLRLWVLDAEVVEVHVPAGHPTLGTGRDRRVRVDPRV
jgi:hypothetical protein